MTSERLNDISLKDIPSILSLLSIPEQELLLAQLTKLEQLKSREQRKSRFIEFVKHVWPTFIAGKHHAIMADAFERVARGELKRLTISLPPRHTKSEFASYLFPAWFLGQFPHKKIIQTSNTAELAVGFGRKVRNLVDSEAYKDVFEGVSLSTDSKAAGRWNTNKQGDYFAIGVGGTMTGKGADCAYFACKVLTDKGIVPISEAEVGDLVYAYDHHSNTPHWTRILAVSTQRKPKLVNVGGFLCTPEHRVYTSAGYKPAVEAPNIAVLEMPNVVSSEDQGASGRYSEGGAYGRRRDAGLLFQSMLHGGEKGFAVPMWNQEVRPRSYVQSLLHAGQAGAVKVLGMLQGVYSAYLRAQEVCRAAWRGRAHFLFEGMLRALPGGQTAGTLSDNRGVQAVLNSRAGQENILQYGLLRQAQGQERRICRELELQKTRGEEARQGGVRPLWEHQGAYSGASYQPRCNGQQYAQFDNAMRAMPQPISLTDRGACASDVEGLLCGEGHWVVDIQTESHNFFVCSPETTSEAAFLRSCVLAHNCLIIDDPHSEQEAKLAEADPAIYDSVYEWYTSGPRQLLQPGGAIIVVATRWSARDLIGRVLKDSAQRGGDEWEVIEFPAIMPSGNPVWPEFWSLDELMAIKATISNAKWMAQYQQSPTSDGAAIVKREWWKQWEEEEPPDCDYILQAWDTAFEANNRADFSACTTWGVFYQNNDKGEKQANLILLNAIKERAEFPTLKRLVVEQYDAYKPDSLIVEKKASGAPLIYELRAMGIPAQDYTPVRGTTNNPNNKMARLNAVSDLFASGIVWAPNTSWAEAVIDEVASFPAGEHDDYVDTCIMALLRFRQGGFLRLPSDEPEEQRYYKRRREGYY
jgi:predicted phage terminase large subunit-like protein